MSLFDLFKTKAVQAPTHSPLLQMFSNAVGSSSRPNDQRLLDQFADHTWIYACIRLIQTKGAGVPLKVYSEKSGKREELPNHKLQRLLDSVNPMMNGYDLREATHGYIELTGKSYWLPDNMVGGLPTAIFTLIPSFITPRWGENGLIDYEYRINGKLIRTFKPDELIVFKTWNPVNPFDGLAPGVPARDVAEMVLNADRYNSAFIKNGATAGGFLTSEKPIMDTTKKMILAAWNKLHSGLKNVNKVGILDGGLKWEGTSTTHSDMQFVDLQKMSIRSLLAAYGIQPVMLGIHEDSNYSNATEQRRAFWIDCMIPRLRKIESVLNERLAPLYGPDIYVAYDLNGVEEMKEDQKAKAERDQIHVGAGIKTINEVRAEMDLSPVPWGDTWNAPFGLMPIESHTAPIAPAGEEIDEEEEIDEKPEVEEPKKAAHVDKGYVRRTGTWVKFKAHTEAIERRWFPPIRRLFSDQEREVIANLRQHWEVKARHIRLNKVKDMRQDLSVILFERGEARKLFQKTGRKLLELALNASAEKEIKDHDLEIQFSVQNPKVSTWLSNKAFKFANAVNLTTEEALRVELVEAVNLGESIAEVEKRIEEVFDIARGPRTQMIARTEVISASNEGAQAAYEQSGIVKGTEWVSSRDAKVRESHQIDGETINMGFTFSNGLKYPGDPSGEAEDVINCRCTIAPVIPKE